MKNISFLIVLLLLFFSKTGLSNSKSDNQTQTGPSSNTQNTLNIICSPELNELTKNWAAEFGRLNPSMKINVSNVEENQANAGTSLYLISNEKPEAVSNKATWKMVICRDAVVPVINSKNPLIETLYRQGISSDKFRQIFTGQQNQNWGTITGSGQNSPVHLYMIDNKSANAGLANFTKTNPAEINGITLATTDELISAIQNDIYAIGFCKLADIRNATTNKIKEGLALLPIDKNGNGRIDSFEKIYGNLETFTRGVWVGKYPNVLCGNVYAMSSAKPADKNELAFLTWIMADGQQFLNPNGYSNLASREIQSNIDKLANTEIDLAQRNKPSASQTWLLILAGIIIAGIAFTAVVRYIRKNKSTVSDGKIHISSALNENAIIAPGGLYFDKTHTWAFMEKDGMVKVGIDDFLQHITGTLTRIKMKEAGEMVRKGEKILTLIRDGKQLNIYTPVSGTIKEHNEALITDSSIINSSPYADGWVYMIEPKNWLREIDFLFMGEKYKEWLRDEFTRLKDFFAASAKSNNSVYAHIILQDGGELTDNVLADLEPEVWEDFQTKFIDSSK